MDTEGKPAGSARERLIQTGMEQFAVYGLQGVRTRTLAELAGVNQAAIPYYFGGKNEFYAAVIESIAREMGEKLAKSGLLFTDEEAQGEHRSTKEYCEHLKKLMKRLTGLILSSERSAERIILIVREQIQPTENFSRLFTEFMEPLHKTLSILISRIQARKPEEKIVLIQAQALVGQALSFIVSHQTFLQRMKESRITQSQAGRIAETVAELSVAAITGFGKAVREE